MGRRSLSLVTDNDTITYNEGLASEDSRQDITDRTIVQRFCAACYNLSIMGE